MGRRLISRVIAHGLMIMAHERFPKAERRARNLDSRRITAWPHVSPDRRTERSCDGAQLTESNRDRPFPARSGRGGAQQTDLWAVWYPLIKHCFPAAADLSNN